VTVARLLVLVGAYVTWITLRCLAGNCDGAGSVRSDDDDDVITVNRLTIAT
jgi:hypothetical protein